MSKIISLDNLQRFKNKWVDPLAERITNLEECIIGDDSLNYTYLSESAIPTNVNSYPIIESAGMDLTDIKGHSVVVNQQFSLTSGAISGNAVISGTDNNFSYSVSVAYAPIFTKYLDGNHKYLIFLNITETNGYVYVGLFQNSSAVQWVITKNTTGIYYYISDRTDFNRINMTSNTTNITNTIKNYMVIDLTQWFGSTDNIPQEVLDTPSLFFTKYYPNVDYIAYNTGALMSSKPTALISKSFNVWDEEWEVGDLYSATGREASANDRIRSKYIKIAPNTTIFFGLIGSQGGVLPCWYDKNKNFISSKNEFAFNNSLVSPPNAEYLRFATGPSYGNTYNHDICINVSNANLNGTYRPYKAPISYPLTLPILRSAGSVQDDVSKVRIGVVDLGTLSWHYETDTNVFSTTGLTGLVKNERACPIISTLYINSGAVSFVSMPNMTFQVYSDTYCVVKNTSYSSASDFKTAMSGVYLYYELATPTDQPAITLPEDIAIEKGGTIQATYDNSNQVPADFDFEVAVYKPIQ